MDKGGHLVWGIILRPNLACFRYLIRFDLYNYLVINSYTNCQYDLTRA